MDDYGSACRRGREEANKLLGSEDNLPKLVRAIRDAAKDGTGFGAGFLFEVAGRVAR